MLSVPRRLELLRSTADGKGVNASSVTVAIAVVMNDSSVSRRPHVDDALASPALMRFHDSLRLFGDNYLFKMDIVNINVVIM